MAIEKEIQELKSEVEVLKKNYDDIIRQLQQRQVEKLLTVKQVANRLHLTAGGVNFHIRKGKLKAVGQRCKKITEAEVLRFMQDNNY